MVILLLYRWIDRTILSCSAATAVPPKNLLEGLGPRFDQGQTKKNLHQEQQYPFAFAPGIDNELGQPWTCSSHARALLEWAIKGMKCS
jgi:hypothetical protein